MSTLSDLEKVVEEVRWFSDFERWDFSIVDGQRAESFELKQSDMCNSYLTFSSIAGVGPPPPSPFPKSSNDAGASATFL
jgi:hypothetical protein